MSPLKKVALMLGAHLLFSGCTHIPLRNNTLHQARTVHQIQQQQVLDNLAMFASDPNAVPYFTVVGAGTSAITDQGNVSTTLSWLRSGFQSVGLTLGGNRLMQENFTLAPLNDPDALARMRCAYQTAIGNPGSPCIDCCGLQKQWGDFSWDGRPASADCQNECLPGPGWFYVGRKCDVPKGCCYVGQYGCTYIWVPLSGSDQLARLTLAILDYATAVPPPAATKTVKRTLKYPPDASKIERTVEESMVVPLDFPIEDGDAEVRSFQKSEFETLPAPIRRDFFMPQTPIPVVIPVQ